MVLFSFLFISSAFVGGSLLLSGCGSSSNYSENNPADENPDDNQQHENDDTSIPDKGNMDDNEEVTAMSSFSIKISCGTGGSFSCGIDGGTSVSNSTNSYTLSGSGSYAWVSATANSGYTVSSIGGVNNTTRVYIYYHSQINDIRISPSAPTSYLIGSGIVSTSVSVTFARTYYIDYYPNGGTPTTPVTQSVRSDSSVSIYTINQAGFSRSGYTFTGWNTNTSGTGTSYRPGQSYSPSRNISLYAQWERTVVTYTYTYYSNPPVSGVAEESFTETYEEGETATRPSCPWSFSSYYYYFGGWSGFSSTVTGNKTINATWDYSPPVSYYDVTYNGNGATGGSTTGHSSVREGNSITIRECGFTKTGYTFVEWNTNSSGTGTSYDPGDSLTVNYNRTLYAIWERDSVNPVISRVTYAQNDGKSYYVYAYASDAETGIQRVQFPTWTEYDWQDDIIWHDGVAGNWSVGGQTYNYRYLVQASEHNNEYGKYITHVYAYDYAGNSVGNGEMTNIYINFNVVVNPNGGSYNGTTSNTTLSNKNGGDVVNLNFTRTGYELTGASTTAGIISKSLLPSTSRTFSGSNYLALGRTYMYSDKITYALYAYMDNWSQYQSGNMRMISCTQSGGFNIEPNGSTVRFAVYDGGKGGYNSITTSVQWSSLSGWVHFAMVFDGVHATGYINGQQVGQSAEFQGNIGYHNSNGIFIGAEAGTNTTKPAGNYFKGQIRNVHIIHDVVKPSELMKLDCPLALICSGAGTVTAQWQVGTYKITYNANGGTLRNYNVGIRTANYSNGNSAGLNIQYDATTNITTINGTMTGNSVLIRNDIELSAGTYTVGYDVISGSMTAGTGNFTFEVYNSSGSALSPRASVGIWEAPLYAQTTLTLSETQASNSGRLQIWLWRSTQGYSFNNLKLRFYFYLNSPAISTQNVTYGQSGTSMAYATKDGYYFNGWNTRADGSGTYYGPGNMGTITSNITLYAIWTARNPVHYDSAGGYYFFECGKMPQSKVSGSLKTTLQSQWSSLSNGSIYNISFGDISSFQAKVYNGNEYCLYNNEYYLVEPIRWRLQGNSNQKSGYGTTTDTLAIMDTIVYVGRYSSGAINAGDGYQTNAAWALRTNQFDYTFVAEWTQSMPTFGTTSLYGTPENFTARIFVSSVDEINTVAGSGKVKFSDLVKDYLKSTGNGMLYYTRDLGTNYNNIICLNGNGDRTQRKPDLNANRLGVQFTIKVTEYACV